MDGRGAPRWGVRLPDVDPHRDIETVRRFGGRLLIPGDGEWPISLEDLGEEAPFCLWVRGPLQLDTTAGLSVAIVGARAATAYGERIAANLGAGCADRGITVVSGAAFGIDGAAHRGALSSGGTTVAVLACGVDRFYPLGHERLLDRIAGEGLVVSEVPPGSSPTRWRFVERNRIIAALTRVVVVVEAAVRSGALGTAARAERISRPLAAVPGPVTSPSSYGTHQLIRDGAVLVTGPEDVAELVGRMGEFLPEPMEVPRTELDDLEPRDRRVAEALPVRTAAELDGISRAAGLEAPAVAAALGRLELRGLAVREGTGWRRTPRAQPRGSP